MVCYTLINKLFMSRFYNTIMLTLLAQFLELFLKFASADSFLSQFDLILLLNISDDLLELLSQNSGTGRTLDSRRHQYTQNK